MNTSFPIRLPALPQPPAALRALIARLPIQPPSLLLAAALNRVLRPRLPADAALELADHTVEIEVRDFGLRCRLALRDGRFRSAPDHGPVALRIAVGYDFQVLPTIPMGEQDEPVDLVVTPSQRWRTGARPLPAPSAKEESP